MQTGFTYALSTHSICLYSFLKLKHGVIYIKFHFKLITKHLIPRPNDTLIQPVQHPCAILNINYFIYTWTNLLCHTGNTKYLGGSIKYNVLYTKTKLHYYLTIYKILMWYTVSFANDRANLNTVYIAI